MAAGFHSGDCAICFSEIRPSPLSMRRFRMEGCDNGEHRVCAGCTYTHVQMQLPLQANPSEVSCPCGEDCGGHLTREQARLLDTKAASRRWSANRQPRVPDDGQATRPLEEQFHQRQQIHRGTHVICAACGELARISTTVPNLVACRHCRSSTCKTHGVGHDPSQETCE